MSPSRSPFEVSPLIYCPGKGMHVLSVCVKGFPDSLTALLKVLAEEGLDIFYIRVPPLTRPASSVCITFIVGLPTANADYSVLLGRLKGLEFVEDVREGEVVLPSLVVDTLHFPPHFAGRRAVILDYPILHSIKLGLSKSFGEKVSEALLWSTGFAVGKSFYEFYRTLYNPLSNEDWAKVFKLVFMALGWFVVEAWDVDSEKGGTVTVSGSWEGTLSGESARACHMIRGVIAGFLTRLFNRSVDVREEECVAEGKECCRFSVKV